MNENSVVTGAVDAVQGMFDNQPQEWRAPMLLPMEQPGLIESAERGMRESVRRERALAAFDTLVMGGDLSLKPNARAEAVDVFGEEFVQNWQDADPVTRAVLAGMRFNEMIMRGEGEDEVDALLRYRDQTGDKSVESNFDMWNHYAKGRKAEIDRAMDARKAEGAKFTDVLSRAVRGEVLTDDDRATMAKGGFKLTDVEAARGAYELMQTVDPANYVRAYELVRGNPVAESVCLSALEDDAAKQYTESPKTSAFLDAVKTMRQGAFLAVSHELNDGTMVENLASDPSGMGATALKYHYKKIAAQDVPRRKYNPEQMAFVGDVVSRLEAGRERGMKNAGLLDEGGAAMAEAVGMMASFTKFTKGFSALGMLYTSQARREAMGRAHAEPMDDETYAELVGAVGREEADRMRADWQRQSSRESVGVVSIWYAGSEYVSMMVGLGGARAAMGRFAPKMTGRMMSRMAPLNAKLYGAAGMGAARATFDLGVAMPLANGALKWAYDQLPFADPKLSTGAEELAGAWAELGSTRHWFRSGVMGLTMTPMHAYQARSTALQILGERKGALIMGLTGEQYDSTLTLPPAERTARLASMYAENMKNAPEETMRRAIAASRAELDRRKAAEMREDAAVSAALQTGGYSVEAGADGKSKLYYDGVVGADGKFVRGEKFMELDEDDLNAFIQVRLGDRLERVAALMREEAGGARVMDAAKRRWAGETEIEWVRPETFRDIEMRGGKATKRYEQRVREEMERTPDADEKEVRKAVAKEVHNDIGEEAIGRYMQHAEDVRQRAKLYEAETGEKVNRNAPFSYAYVRTIQDGARKRRILRVANGATVRMLTEEFGEQMMQDWMDAEQMDMVTAFHLLDALRRTMAESKDEQTRGVASRFLQLHKRMPALYKRVMEEGGTDSMAELREVRRDVIEGLSTLLLSDFAARAERGEVALPSWSRSLFDASSVGKLEFEQDIALGAALEKASKEGWMPEAVRKMFDMTEREVADALRPNPSVEEYYDAYMERARRQAEFDAHDGRLNDPDALEDFYIRATASQKRADEARAAAEREAQEKSDEQMEEMSSENEGESHEELVKKRAELYDDVRQDEIVNNPTATADDAFCGGKCLEVEDETGLVCRGGLLETEKLTILPNFKQGADSESGVVEPLTGDYRPDHDPIRVWQREVGSLQVISGRHRLDAAKRAGASRIMAYVYREDVQHDELWARRYDIESNIRDNQATPLEVALYVRGEYTGGKPLTDVEVARAGIDRKGKMGSVGYQIGRDAGDSVMDALRNGLIDDREALAIAHFCPNDETVQRVGLKMALDGASRAEIQERMAAEVCKQEMQQSLGLGGTDLFGNAIDDDAFMTFCSKYVVRRRNELAKDAQYLRMNAGRKNSAAMAKKYGVNVNDPDALRAKLKELDTLRERWKHPYTDPELLDEIREAFRAENPDAGVSADERVFRRYAENADALRDRQMMSEDYSVRAGQHEVLLKGRHVDLRKVCAFDKEGRRLSKDAYLTTPKGDLEWYRFDDAEAAWLSSNNLPVLPVRMKVGAESSRGGGGFGFIHTLKHAVEMMESENVTPLEYFYRLSRHIAAMKNDDQHARKNPRGNVFGVTGENTGKLVIELRPDEGCYTVISVHPHDIDADAEKIRELQIGGTVIRFLPSGEADQFEASHQQTKTAADTHSAQGTTPAANLPRHQQVVNIHDVNFLDEFGEIVHFEPYNEMLDFSVAGVKAAGIDDARRRGVTYVDPADGKEKFVIPLRGKDGKRLARLNTNFTNGQLYSVPVGGHRDVSLEALLHYDELYRNYPELRKMRVRLYNPTKDEPRLGYSMPAHNGEAAYIGINVRNQKAYFPDMEARNADVLNTLLHETQHSIQHYEGMARGANSEYTKQQCLDYIDSARQELTARGVTDDWSRDNRRYLDFLYDEMVKAVEGSDEFNNLVSELYWQSHGEQEARWTGEGNGYGDDVPRLGGDDNFPSWRTIGSCSAETADILGGVTFSGMGRFGRLLEDRLFPGGEFTFDQRVYQMYENIVRRLRELDSQGRDTSGDGMKLAAEGLALFDNLAAMLPDTYRFALEPYKVYFNSYAKLRGTGSTHLAGAEVPMTGWDVRMEGAYEGIVREMLAHEPNGRDAEFWDDALRDFVHLRKTLPDMRIAYAAARDAAEQNHQRPVKESPQERRKRMKAIDGETMREMMQQYPALMKELYKAVGEMRADKMMAKFLERVRLQLDAYRKDRTLGKIRRAVDVLTPKGGEHGKPVKGHIGADDYRRVLDYVRLMELTKGQRDDFMDKYAPDDEPDGNEVYNGMRRWADVAPEELLDVVTYGERGEELHISCTKQEYEVYACFDAMSSAQAEAAARALGEFIKTGRQAWENAEDAARQRIAARCAPLLEGFAETENERRARRKREERAWVSPVKKMLNFLSPTMNDAQFFDSLTGVKEIEPFAREFTDRIAKAHVYMESKEKARHGFMMDAVCRAAGTTDRKAVRDWFDRVNRSENTGLTLKPGEPDFLGRETERVRLQLLGLLRRKTHEKNFRPNNFAEALRYLAEDTDTVPPDMLQEVMHKYGSIGDASKAKLKGRAALNSLLTEGEMERFRNVSANIKKRAKAAREKWVKETQENHGGTLPTGDGESLNLTRLEAAYRVLMCEQDDYRDMLALQGYDAATVGALRRFAGDDVMRLAYDLRDKLGERTADIREIYERVYGMPFPEVENYFRAYFDVHHAEKRETTLDGQGTGKAAGSGRVRILYTRQHHNQKLDPTMDVVTAFNAAMKEQDVLIGYGDLPSDITRLVNYRQGGVRMVDALHATIGAEATDTMLLHANNMKQLTGGAEETARGMLLALRALSSPSAVLILNYRLASLVKQYTAVFNTVAGSDLVGMRDWGKSLARVDCGLGKISVKDIAARPELESRFKGWSAGVEQEMLFGYGDNVSTEKATDAAFRAGMSLMEWADVRANAKSAAVLYDAVYRKLEKQNKGVSHDALDSLAMDEVRRALAMKSQPMDWRQRALLGTKASIFKVGNLFLGGESMNLLGNLARLAARGKKGDWVRLAQVWFSHGAALSLLTMAYNFLTDDEEQWEKRNLWSNFFWGTLMGPVNGIPFLSQVAGGAVNLAGMFLPKETRGWVQTSSMVPLGDLNRAVSDVLKVFWGKKPSSWQDKTIAVNNLLRTMLVFSAAAFSNPTTKTGAAVKGASYALGAAGNIADFLLRVERAAEERL